MEDKFKDIKLTDFYTQEELDKWGLVVYKELWHQYHEDKPKVSDAIEIGDGWLQINEMKEVFRNIIDDTGWVPERTFDDIEIKIGEAPEFFESFGINSRTKVKLSFLKRKYRN